VRSDFGFSELADGPAQQFLLLAEAKVHRRGMYQGRTQKAKTPRSVC
jgi:hypothetical protein